MKTHGQNLKDLEKMPCPICPVDVAIALSVNAQVYLSAFLRNLSSTFFTYTNAKPYSYILDYMR